MDGISDSSNTKLKLKPTEIIRPLGSYFSDAQRQQIEASNRGAQNLLKVIAESNPARIMSEDIKKLVEYNKEIVDYNKKLVASNEQLQMERKKDARRSFVSGLHIGLIILIVEQFINGNAIKAFNWIIGFFK